MRITLLLILLAMAVATGAMVISGRNIAKISPTQGLQQGEVASTGTAAIGGAFTLTDVDGQTVTEETLKGGKYHLLFFGFTNCPDVCPTMLQMVADTLQKLPPQTAAKIQPVFITVDPERDDAATLKSYIADFDPRITAWRGTDEQLKAMAKNYLVYYARRNYADMPSPTTPSNPQSPIPNSQYTMDHSAFLYLFNPQGEYAAHFPNSTSQQVLIDKLTTLTE